MTIFLVLLFVYTFCVIDKKYRIIDTQRIIIYLFLFAPLFILCAFRDVSVGNDTSMYFYGYQRFASFSDLPTAIQTSRYELGYVILNYIFNKWNLSYYTFQIVISSMIYISFFIFLIRYSTDFLFSVFVFYVLRYSIGTMNVVRMWMAIGILLFSIPYIIDRKLVKFVLIVLLAAMFHSSALVFLVIYPLARININRNTIILVIGVCTLILFASRSFFTRLTSIIGRYGGYLSTDFDVENNVAVYLTLLIDLILFILIFFTLNRDGEEDKNHVPLERILVMSALLAVGLDIIGLGNTVMNRVSAYFSVLYILSIPMAIQRIERSSNKGLLKAGVIFGLAAQFLVIMILRPNWSGVVPFSFFWQHY